MTELALHLLFIFGLLVQSVHIANIFLYKIARATLHWGHALSSWFVFRVGCISVRCNGCQSSCLKIRGSHFLFNWLITVLFRWSFFNLNLCFKIVPMLADCCLRPLNFRFVYCIIWYCQRFYHWFNWKVIVCILILISYRLTTDLWMFLIINTNSSNLFTISMFIL